MLLFFQHNWLTFPEVTNYSLGWVLKKEESLQIAATAVLTDQIPLLSSNQQHPRTEGKYRHYYSLFVNLINQSINQI